jgi:hypothetical protein
MNALRTLVALAGIAVAMPAQSTIYDGNMNAVFGALSATSQMPRSLQLRSDALAIDHGFQAGWYYRVAGDTREFSLRNIGGVAEALAGFEHLDRDFADVDARGLLEASIDCDVYDNGPASGVVVTRLTLMNRSNAPVVVDAFHYQDLDIAATFGDDVCTGNGSAHVVTDGSGVQIEVRAVGNDRSAVGAFPTVRDLLTNPTFDDLPNTLPPFNGDYSGAFQWQNRTLQPFEQRTFTVFFIADTAGASLPLNEHYGAGSSTTLEIHTHTVAVQDNTAIRGFLVQMKGALPNVQHLFLAGAIPSFPFPYIPGIDLWIDPASTLGTFGHGVLTSSTGEAVQLYLIPPSPYLAGINVFFQGFAEDAAAANGFANWTPGLRIRVGKI